MQNIRIPHWSSGKDVSKNIKEIFTSEKAGVQFLYGETFFNKTINN